MSKSRVDQIADLMISRLKELKKASREEYYGQAEGCLSTIAEQSIKLMGAIMIEQEKALKRKKVDVYE